MQLQQTSQKITNGCMAFRLKPVLCLNERFVFAAPTLTQLLMHLDHFLNSAWSAEALRDRVPKRKYASTKMDAKNPRRIRAITGPSE